MSVYRYKVDVAVRHPEKNGEYLIGIEGDGPVYHGCQFARDRDRIRSVVMQRMGWSLHRVWMPDWLNNPARELERIRDAITKALTKGKDTEISEGQTDDDAPRERPKTDPMAVAAAYKSAPSFGEDPSHLDGARQYKERI